MKNSYTIALYLFVALALGTAAFWSITLIKQYSTISSYKKFGRMQALLNELNNERRMLANERLFLSNYIKAGRKDTGLLKKIGELNRDFDITFVSTGPIMRQTSGNYIKTLRKLSFEGNYFETVRFLNNLEKVKEINVSDLSIQKMDEKKYFVELEANNFFLKDKSSFGDADVQVPDNASTLYADVHEASALLPIPTSDKGLTFMQMLVVRDPFAEPPLQVFPASAVAAGVKLGEDSPDGLLTSSSRKGFFVLTGIISYPDHSIIIVEGTDRIPKTYRSGDRIGSNQIGAISRDQVLITEGDGEQRSLKIGAQFF